MLVGLYEEPEKPNNALEYPFCSKSVMFVLYSLSMNSVFIRHIFLAERRFTPHKSEDSIITCRLAM